MNKEEIIRMAREAANGGIPRETVRECYMLHAEELERFAALVAAADQQKRIAAQIENEELKAKLAASGVSERRAVREAVLAEREECAKVCDELAELNRKAMTDSMWQQEECAAAIRARGGK